MIIYTLVCTSCHAGWEATSTGVCPSCNRPAEIRGTYHCVALNPITQGAHR